MRAMLKLNCICFLFDRYVIAENLCAVANAALKKISSVTKQFDDMPTINTE